MQVLGTIPIPDIQYVKKDNRAGQARELLQNLQPGKATLVEFVTSKEAHDMRSMLYTMSILFYGESGHISTRITENLMYVWLTQPENIPVSLPTYLTKGVTND